MDTENKNVKENDDIENDVSESYRINRRTFMKVAGATVGAIALGTGLSKLIEPAMAVAPVRLRKFVDALVIPPVLDTTAGGTYNISMVPGTAHKFHSAFLPTKTYSYFDVAPALDFHYLGPTIIAKRGIPVKIKFTNLLPSGPHMLNTIPPNGPLSPIDTTIMGNLDGVNADGLPWVDENRVCVHLHGGKVPVEFDGGPRDWFSRADGQLNPYPEAVDPFGTGSYTYEYPNDQPATLLWYHDHAWGITRFNPFAGLAGAYLLLDEFDISLRTGIASPSGYNTSGQTVPAGVYEVPIVLQDKLLDTITGAMLYPVAANNLGTHPIWIPEYFGDTPVINGKAYPYHNVEPRRYRLRFLNGSNARFYNLWFDAGVGPIPFHVIGSEQGFLPAPALVNRLLIAPGERFDTIVDFTGLAAGTTLLLKNNAKAPYPGGAGGMGQLMQFKVIPIGAADITTPAPALVLPPIAPTPTPTVGTPREIVLSEIMDPLTGLPMEALLDGLHFTDTLAPNPLFVEQENSVNVWQFINTTGDAHPMHPHLVPFKIQDRQPFDVAGFTAAWNAWIAGAPTAIPPIPPRDPLTRPSINAFLTKGLPYLPAPEESGWKDTAKAYPGEVLRIVSKFELPANAPVGIHSYVCHCHILEHEENDMMFNWAVQKL